jgi:hypothetical protein
MTRKFLKSLNVFMHADSLGGCESLAQVRKFFEFVTCFSSFKYFGFLKKSLKNFGNRKTTYSDV